MRTEDLLAFERFEAARQKKFDKGRKEHGQPWTPKDINYISEIKDELLDLYNYASLGPSTDRVLTELMRISQLIWIKLDERNIRFLLTNDEK